VWTLVYDAGQQAFYFYPYRGSTSTEIFTGAHSVPANTWTQVEVRYTATSAGGAQLFLNGQSQPGWTVSGNYARSNNFQRLLLWNSTSGNNDFDDVTVAVPGAASPTAPGAPTNVTATAGNGSASLTWSAAAPNGSTITTYRVTPYANGVAQTPIVTGSASTNDTVTGLTNVTSYTFTVAATNGVGTGPDSAASNAVTPAAAPGPPTNVAGTAGNASVQLSWTAPSSNGGSSI